MGRLHAPAFGRELNNAGNRSTGWMEALIEFVAHFEEGLLDCELKFRRMSLTVNTPDMGYIARIIEVKKPQAECSQIGILGRVIEN
jgi:hypothetical protein